MLLKFAISVYLYSSLKFFSHVAVLSFSLYPPSPVEAELLLHFSFYVAPLFLLKLINFSWFTKVSLGALYILIFSYPHYGHCTLNPIIYFHISYMVICNSEILIKTFCTRPLPTMRMGGHEKMTHNHLNWLWKYGQIRSDDGWISNRGKQTGREDGF